MTITSSPSFSIVVGLDFLDAGGYAFEQAARIARAIPGSQIHVVHVFANELDAARRAELKGQLGLYVNEKAASLGGLPLVGVGIHLRAGDTVRGILQLASDVAASMIVIGAKTGPHPETWLVGSVAERLLLWAACPVLVAGPKPARVHQEPVIEPPCADCERTRAASKRAVWWCERHATHAASAHVFSYERELPLSTPDSLSTPGGAF